LRLCWSFRINKPFVLRTYLCESNAEKEQELLFELLSEDFKGRGKDVGFESLRKVERLIEALEVNKPISSKVTKNPTLDGVWKLLYTSSPGTNSPIQRTFTAVDFVSIYQVR
jgi:hypothetical protein